jgi:dihydroxyacetone kinase-like predicted kinase
MGEAVDAGVLREAMARYLDALREHREELDSLNVFLVPDGDTGTNLLFTQQAVAEAVEAVDPADLSVVGEAITGAALIGSSRELGGDPVPGPPRAVLAAVPGRPERAAVLAQALRQAADEAAAAVAEPVEGTMLTVLREATDAAAVAVADGIGCDQVADAATTAGLAALDRTPEVLLSLREAGVVDAGGKGLVLLLDALVSALRGTPLRVEVGPPGPVGGSAGTASNQESAFGFEVMYLFACEDAAVPHLRGALAKIGDSVVVVGGSGLYTVHVHTDDPGRAVEESLAAGRPRAIRITSLDRQVAEACLAGQARAVRVGEAPGAPARTGVVAVAPGEGAARLFRSLGAEVVAGERPSAEAMRAAIDRTGAAAVLVLTNGGEVADEAVRAVTGDAVTARVLRTGSVLQGLAAAAAVSTDASLAESAARAEEAAGTMAGGEVAEPDPAIVVDMVRSLHRHGSELVTLLAGRAASDEDAERAGAAVREAFPSLEVEVHRGDQPGGAFLVGVE